MRSFRSVASGLVVASALLASFSGTPVRAGDDAQFTLVVAREYNLYHARAANQHIYIDEKYLGGVSNGYRVRFAVPTNASGDYSVRVRFWDSVFTGGIVKKFSAKPGDEVIVSTGTDYAWVDGTAVRSVHVFPLASAKLLVNPPPGGITLAFNGHEHRIDSSREITTTERTTENRSLRLEIAANRAGRQDKVVVFARPGKTGLLDFTQHLAHDDESIVSSIQLLAQLRACVFHHLGGDLNDLQASIGRMEADIRALHANGADQEVLDLRERYVSYFRELLKLSDNSAVGALAGNVLMGALGCAAEALMTQSVPSQSTVLLSSTGALLSTGYDRFQVSSKVSQLNNEFKSAEEAVIATLRKELRSRPSLRRHSVAKELIVAEEILGAWSYDFPLPKGAGNRREKYIFSPDGKLTEIWSQGSGVEAGKAIYETDGSRVIVRWDSSAVETAVVEKIDSDHLSYQIIGHTGSPRQVGMKFVFTRTQP